MGALPRFTVDVRGVGAYPSVRKASVIWVGVEDGAGHLGGVARAVEEVAAALGLGERETRPFRGHVTVGRAKGGVDARRGLEGFSDRPFGAVEVSEVHVYESQLGGDGSTYVLRSRAALNSN